MRVCGIVWAVSGERWCVDEVEWVGIEEGVERLSNVRGAGDDVRGSDNDNDNRQPKNGSESGEVDGGELIPSRRHDTIRLIIGRKWREWGR